MSISDKFNAMGNLLNQKAVLSKQFDTTMDEHFKSITASDGVKESECRNKLHAIMDNLLDVKIHMLNLTKKQ